MNRKGFTLVELLIVCGVICILLALAGCAFAAVGSWAKKKVGAQVQTVTSLSDRLSGDMNGVEGP
jgi:prepilin-type N-terminal cleavage/methylation domain-containing protein